jgi:Flp pilus assembly protein TadG
MTRRIINYMDSGGKGRGLGLRRSNESGQVAVLFALVFTFMFVLFAFVVDFGHLVNAKMNLQIAADAAAYSGAAYQAQLLNRVGQINYKMRQDLKELAMRVNVTHLRHNRGFPRGTGAIGAGDSRANVEPFICQQAHGYRAISGLRYADDTNLCRNASPSSGGLPPIVVPPVIAAFDPFAVAIATQIRRIADAANQECRAAANDNRILVEHLRTVYVQRSQAHLNQARAMQEFMNGIGSGNAEGADSPVVQAALESARRNLTPANTEEFQLEVLQPSGGQYLSLIEHRMRASLFYFDFNVVGDGCVGRPRTLDFDDMVVGITKDQPIITYFAVKASSKPTMMFMPQAWQEALFPRFEAFAAAKPFGSRIGPESTADPLVPVPNRPGNASRSINFSFRPGDQFGILSQKKMAFFDALHPFNGAGRPQGEQQQGWPDPDKGQNLRSALQAIRAPTIFDAAFYTIHPDPTSANDYEESNFAAALYPDYLEAGGPDNNIIQQNPPSTRPYLPEGVGPAQSGDGWIAQFARNVAGNSSYGRYATEGPASHSVTLAANSNLPQINDGNANEFGWATRQQLHSGWTPPGRPGRIGYSVKFIGFDALVRTMRIKLNESGSRGPISNPPTGDDNIVNIYH